MKTFAFMIIFALALLPGCRPTETVIPDSTIPHQISKKVRVKVWVRKKGDVKQEVELEFLPGWWILPPQWAADR